MSITVQHSPDFNLLGGVAAQAGFGMYRQRQDQQDLENFLRQQALAQQAAQNQQRMQLAAQQQALDADARARQQLLEAGRLQAGVQQNQIENKFRNDQLQGQNNWRDQQIQQEKLQREHALGLQQQGNQARFELDTVNDLDKIVDGVRSEAIKLQLNPEGKNVQGELMRALRGIQKERLRLGPKGYSQALGQWLDNYERAKLQDYVVETPPPDQRLEGKRVIERDEFGNPTGRQFLENSKGEWKEVDPPKAGAGQQNPGVPLAHGQVSPSTKAPTFGVPHDPQAMPSLQEYYSNPKTYNDDYKMIREQLTEPGETGLGEVKGKDKVPSHDAIEAEMKKRYESRMKMVAPKPKQGPQQGQPQTAPPQLPNWAEGQISGQPVPQFAPDVQPGVPAPPVPQPPPQMVPPAAPAEAPRVMLPQHKPAYEQVVKAVGSPDVVNEDALAQVAQAEEVRAQGGGQKFLEGIATKTARLKELKAKGKLTEAEKAEGAKLALEVMPYLKRKSK